MEQKLEGVQKEKRTQITQKLQINNGSPVACFQLILFLS